MMRRFSISWCALILAAWISPAASGVTIAGQVVDGDGEPIGGAEVWVSQERRVRQAETEANGAYRFDGLNTGAIELTALKEGHALGGVTAFAVGDTELTLSLGEPGRATIHVVDHRSEPIPGARVKSLSVSGRFVAPVDVLADHGFPVLRSDDEGIIEIPFVPAGGFVQAVIQHNDYIDSRPTFLPDREKPTYVALREGLRLRGRVVYDGKPVPDTRVSVFQSSPRGQVKVSETLTDGDGLFRFVALSGLYHVALRHPNYASPEPISVPLTEQTQDEVHVLSLLTPCVITGRILLPSGEGCGGVRVAYREGNVVYEDVFTDVEGRYTLRVPGGADGFLRIEAPPGYMTDMEEELPLAIGEQRYVHVQDFELTALPTLRGTVLADGAPASNALVVTINLTNPSLAITDDEGKFVLPLSDVPKGKIALARAEHALRFLRKDFAVHLDEASPVELTLEPYTPDQTQKPDAHYRNDMGALLNDPAPDLACEYWFNTEPLQLVDLRGKVVVLTLWAGFDETPLGYNRIQEMRALHDLYADTDDVVVVSVHDGSSPREEVEDYVRRYGITYPVGVDKDPLVTFDRYGVNFIPQTVLIDKQGVLRYFQTEGRLLELIKVLRRRN